MVTDLLTEFYFRIMLVQLGCSFLFGVPITFLKNPNELLALAVIQHGLIIAGFVPPGFGHTSDLFPFALENILIHSLSLQIIKKPRQLSQFTPALGTALVRRISSLSVSQVAS